MTDARVLVSSKVRSVAACIHEAIRVGRLQSDIPAGRAGRSVTAHLQPVGRNRRQRSQAVLVVVHEQRCGSCGRLNKNVVMSMGSKERTWTNLLNLHYSWESLAEGVQ